MKYRNAMAKWLTVTSYESFVLNQTHRIFKKSEMEISYGLLAKLTYLFVFFFRYSFFLFYIIILA